MDFPPTSEEYNNLNTINKIKALEKEIKRLRQNDDDGTTQKINKPQKSRHSGVPIALNTRQLDWAVQ